MSEEEQIILPDGYTKLEWISADGASYLQLPITTAAGDKVVLETNCRFYSLDNQADGKNGNPHFFFGINNGVWYCGAGNYGNSSIIADTDWHRIKLIHSSSDCGLYIDDVKINSRTYNSTSAVLNGNICVFRTYGGSYYSKNCKKDWKLYVNDEIVYDLIPCLDNDSIPCMYDLVSKQTFYKQGTGNLLTDKTFLENYPYPTANYNLPANFKKCVYLQSDGTQWINTQVVPNTETGLYFKALQLSYGNFVPVGLEENRYAIYPPRYNNKELYYKWGNASTKIMTWDKANDLIFSSYLNFYNSKIAKFNSDDTDAYSQITSQTGTFTIPIWLFTYNVNGSYNATYGKWGGRIYRAQITQGDALIRDFVPCLDADNRPCMYDLITQEAYYNQSEGTEFSYCVEHELPSDFVKLKYLESDRTQFIKTDYVPTNTTGLYIDAYNTVGGDFVPMGCRNDTGNTRFFIGRVTKTNAAGYGWGSWISPGGTGDCRYDATLNWLNDRKSIINAPAFAQRVNNLGTLPHTPLYGINIFGANHQDTSNVLAWKGRIYRAKISEGDQIVRDFVPAYNTRRDKPCMYDLINNVAYYNDGIGEFLYNRDFEGTYKGFVQLGGIGNRLGSGNVIHGILPENPDGSEAPDGIIFKEYISLYFDNNNFIDTQLISNDENLYRFCYYSIDKDETILSGNIALANGNLENEIVPNKYITFDYFYDEEYFEARCTFFKYMSNSMFAMDYDDYEDYIREIEVIENTTNETTIIKINGNEFVGDEVYEITNEENKDRWRISSINKDTKVLKFKIYNKETNELVSELIPSENVDGKEGMYCTVRNIFLPVQSY